MASLFILQKRLLQIGSANLHSLTNLSTKEGPSSPPEGRHTLKPLLTPPFPPCPRKQTLAKKKLRLKRKEMNPVLEQLFRVATEPPKGSGGEILLSAQERDC